jgi:hypothetical protein
MAMSRLVSLLFIASPLVVADTSSGATQVDIDASFVQWLKAGGADMNKMGLEIANFPKEGGRGIRATKQVEEGVLLIQVPQKLVFSSDYAAEAIAQLSMKGLDAKGPVVSKPCEQLIVALAQHRLHIDSAVAIMKAANSDDRNIDMANLNVPDSTRKWLPYINALPEVKDLNLPSLLQGTYESGKANTTLGRLRHHRLHSPSCPCTVILIGQLSHPWKRAKALTP